MLLKLSVTNKTTRSQIVPLLTSRYQNPYQKKTGVILSQLRNYSTYLNSNTSRLDEQIQKECPDYKESPQDTQTLFRTVEKTDNFNYL